MKLQNGKHNRKWVEKTCQHCHKEFGTDMPWQKHCSWGCSRDHARDLQTARRAKIKQAKGSGIGRRVCLVCRGSVDELCVTRKNGKGVCYRCMEILESLRFDKGMAYRAGYVISAMFDTSNNRQDRSQASRQGRA